MVPFDLYDMPYSHSLLGSVVFAVIFGTIVFLRTRNRVGAMIAGGVVLSHWFLDLLVHAPDLTLAGDPPKYGLGLWNHPAIAMPLELGITYAALFWYWRVTRGSALPVVVLGVSLAIVQAINWFGPPPAAADAGMYLMALASFGALAAIAWWVGRNSLSP